MKIKVEPCDRTEPKKSPGKPQKPKKPRFWKQSRFASVQAITFGFVTVTLLIVAIWLGTERTALKGKHQEASFKLEECQTWNAMLEKGKLSRLDGARKHIFWHTRHKISASKLAAIKVY